MTDQPLESTEIKRLCTQNADLTQKIGALYLLLGESNYELNRLRTHYERKSICEAEIHTLAARVGALEAKVELLGWSGSHKKE
jgi:hypothetical protein